MTEVLFDPLFRLPLLTGLLLAGLLPMLGALAMLREEWLAALGLAHLASASALLGQALGVPAVVGATLGALGGGALKTFLSARGNIAYGFMILAGWSATLLIGANTALGEQLAQALVEGQIYFVGLTELIAGLLLLALCIRTLPRLMQPVLRARFFPRYETANQLPAWRWHLGLDLLTAGGLAIGTLTLGLMGAFALVLIPAWITFRLAPSWRWTLIGASLTGVAGYLLAFVAALELNQPFGPMLVGVLLGMTLLVRSLERSRPMQLD